VPPAIFRRPCTRADCPAPGRGPSGRQAGKPSPCARSRTVRPQVADRPRLTREHRRRFFLSIWRSEKASTLRIFLSSSRVDICCGHSSPVATAQLQKYPTAVRWYLSPQLARSWPSPAGAPIPWPKPPSLRSGRPAQFFF
jgi:hypothetical protein